MKIPPSCVHNAGNLKSPDEESLEGPFGRIGAEASACPQVDPDFFRALDQATEQDEVLAISAEIQTCETAVIYINDDLLE